MKRKLIAFSMTMALLLSVFSAANVGAHPVTIDQVRSEWFATEPDVSGEGVIARNAAGQGEWIWNDAKKDQRSIAATSDITREADLDWFAVTGDASAISFLAKMERYSGVTNNPPVELMISIDTTQGSASGQTALPATAGISVTSQARWEYVVDTAISGNPDGSGTTKIWKNTAATPSSSNCNTCQAKVAGAAAFQGDFVEIRVPWDVFNGSFTGNAGAVKPTPDKPWRFTVSTYYNDNPRPIPTDGNPSAVIDILGTQGGAGGTLADLNNSPANTIDTYFDINFAASGEVYSPLLITEFQPNPPGQDDPTRASATDSEWVEIYNPNTFAVNLSQYKIGDAASRGASSEAMLQFPNNSSLGAGKFAIVAKDKAKFTARYGATPGGAGAATVYDVSQLSTYNAWATGGAAKFDLANGASSGTPTIFEEQVVLLDSADTIADMVTYAWPNTTPTRNSVPIVVSQGTDVPEGSSFERCPSTVDTNDNTRDFGVHPSIATQTPGVICTAVEGIDLAIDVAGPPNVDSTIVDAPIQYVIPFSNNGQSPASNVVITGTLPSQVTFVSQESSVSAPNPAAVFTPGSPLSWSYSSLAAGATGVITVNVTLNSGAGLNTAFDTIVGISSTPSEAVTTKTNNVRTATVTTLGPADLVISSTLAGTVPPGTEFSYTINYQNAGQNDTNDVIVTSVLPAGVTLVSEDSPDASFAGGTSGSLTWNVSSLPKDTSGFIVVTAKVDSTVAFNTQLPITNSITVPAGDPTAANNTETKSITVGLRKLYIPIQLK
jgi:uncharacterized repeat protein (TIGR01451 family)